MQPLDIDKYIEPPMRHVSSRNLILEEDELFDLDLNLLDINEHDKFSC